MSIEIVRATAAVRKSATVVKTSHCFLEHDDDCDEDPTVTFFPCGHELACTSCWNGVRNAIKKCPMGSCGEVIQFFAIEGEADAEAPTTIAGNAFFLNSIRAKLAAERPAQEEKKKESGASSSGGGRADFLSKVRQTLAGERPEATKPTNNSTSSSSSTNRINVRALLAEKSITHNGTDNDAHRRRLQQATAKKRKRGVTENLPSGTGPINGGGAGGVGIFSEDFLAAVRSRMETDFISKEENNGLSAAASAALGGGGAGGGVGGSKQPPLPLLKGQSAPFMARAKEVIREDIVKRRAKEATLVQEVVSSANGRRRAVPAGGSVEFAASLSWANKERPCGVSSSADSRAEFLVKVKGVLQTQTQ